MYYLLEIIKSAFTGIFNIFNNATIVIIPGVAGVTLYSLIIGALLITSMIMVLRVLVKK